MKRLDAIPPLEHSVGGAVLEKLLLPPHAEGSTALVRGELLEVLREFCHGVPLCEPQCTGCGSSWAARTPPAWHSSGIRGRRRFSCM